MQAVLSGPEPAKTLPVYDAASHAGPSRGRAYAGKVDKCIPVPGRAELSVPVNTASSVLISWATLVG